MNVIGGMRDALCMFACVCDSCAVSSGVGKLVLKLLLFLV